MNLQMGDENVEIMKTQSVGKTENLTDEYKPGQWNQQMFRNYQTPVCAVCKCRDFRNGLQFYKVGGKNYCQLHVPEKYRHMSRRERWKVAKS